MSDQKLNQCMNMESKYKNLVEESMSGLYIHINGQLDYVNPVYAQIFGYTQSEILNMNFLDLFHPNDRLLILDHLRKLTDGEMTKSEYQVRGIKKDQSIIYIDVHEHVKEANGQYLSVYGTLFDRTEARREMEPLQMPNQAEDLIQYLAYHDSLTDLPNRRLFTHRLNKALEEAKVQQTKLAVIFLDIDGFKTINDSFGHDAGDQLLKAIAKRLVHCVRRDDTVARIGGDEFMFLLPKIHNLANAKIIARKILNVFKQPFKLNENKIHITPSVGVSIFPIHGEDANTLIKRSDTAMYYAKEQGKNNYQLYTEDLETQSLERQVLENDLRKAIFENGIELYYQPKIDIDTGQIVGMETLVRWQHQELGIIPPSKFIPIAEESGMIIPLGDLILRTACKQNKAWQQQGYPPLRMSVNLSPVQFKQKNIVKNIIGILNETGLGAGWLELEITEMTILENIEEATEKIQQLKEKGIYVSIDDFGTGYSSLSYLKECSIDSLKIDQSFIRGLSNHLNDQAVVSAIISIAHNLNLNVIAEGVETAEQMTFLRKNGCKEVQGYLFSRPVNAEQFESILSGSNRVYLEHA